MMLHLESFVLVSFIKLAGRKGRREKEVQLLFFTAGRSNNGFSVSGFCWVREPTRPSSAT